MKIAAYATYEAIIAENKKISIRYQVFGPLCYQRTTKISVIDYTTFSVDDFVCDEFFQKGVLHPEEETTAFWEKWIAEHPEKEFEVIRARAILHELLFPDFHLNEEEMSDLWNDISDASIHKRSRKKTGRWWYFAADRTVQR